MQLSLCWALLGTHQRRSHHGAAPDPPPPMCTGNAAFQAAQYEQAIELYSAALEAGAGGQDAAAVHSNRAAARLKLGLVDAALADAEAAIGLCPNWEKGHFRRGCALQAQGDLLQVGGAASQHLRWCCCGLLPKRCSPIALAVLPATCPPPLPLPPTHPPLPSTSPTQPNPTQPPRPCPPYTCTHTQLGVRVFQPCPESMPRQQRSQRPLQRYQAPDAHTGPCL